MTGKELCALSQSSFLRANMSETTKKCTQRYTFAYTPFKDINTAETALSDQKSIYFHCF